MRFAATILWALLVIVVSAPAAVTISGVTDKTKYTDSVSFTVAADPGGVTTTATLDGAPTLVGTNVSVTAIGYHELRAESRDAGGGLIDSRLVRFIVRNSARGGSEDGIPTHTPLNSVDDAPSAFSGGVLKVIAPRAWPVGLPVPMAVVLRDEAGEGLRLNGTVHLGAFPGSPIKLRRGWGSVVVPAVATAGDVALSARLHGLSQNPTLTFESGATYTDVSGAITTDTTWPANSRIRVTGTLTINVGATLTVGAGTIVLVDTGTTVNGSAAEIVVHGGLILNGVEGNPIVVAPATAGRHWGGVELRSATSLVQATHTIFTGAGEDETWFNTNSGFSTHKVEQALFLIAGSGSGTAVGAQLHLTDCYCFSLAGQQMNSKTNTWINFQRVLMQRCVSCGELNGSKVTIDRSALIEFPGEDGAFADADNDAIYLTNGDLSITNTVLGFCKDDGIDSGGNGGDNPYTAAVDVTPFISEGNWFESIFHEGNSQSGTRNVTHSGCVFLNCGQGVEVGYSSGSSADGPNTIVDGCLFVGNMVGVRWGDNYGSGYNYNGTGEVKNSIFLQSGYRDVFSGQWHPSQANAWIYQTLATNTFGRAYFNVHDNYLSQPDPARHPLNTAWNPGAHAALLAPFMPVPGSAVGVAVSSYAPRQQAPAAYPGSFAVRLSTFSALPVSVDWKVVGRVDPFDDAGTVLASGTLSFAPGEMVKTISAPVASPASYALLHVALSGAVNAEVTGEAFFIAPPAGVDPIAYVPASGSGWRYRQARSEPPADWKELTFDDSGAEWLNATLPAGFGGSGPYSTTVDGGPSSSRTLAFYFRKKFTVVDPAQLRSATLRIRRDDAAAVWLNAAPAPLVVSASGAFNGPYTYAMTGVPNSSTSSFITYDIPTSAFVAGENILAIEVHQTSLDSSDILLDCELISIPEPPLDLNYRVSDGLPLLWWFDAAAVLEESADLIEWSPAPVPGSPVRIPLRETRGFFRLRR